MNYEEFDIGNFEDEICIKILESLRIRPMEIYELSKKVFDNKNNSFKLSSKLQKLKRLGIVSNVKDNNNICYWGVEKKYRKSTSKLTFT